LQPATNYAYELVIDGESEEAVAAAMKTALPQAVGPGILAVGAGNYGGKLGKFHFYLHKLLG
jgi:formylmethanofuran--tetrahydromethanopterin N-formyltransferase